MSTFSGVMRMDWVNPVLVRDCRQVVRSKLFMWVSSIWLVLQLVIGLLYIASIDPEDAAMSLAGPGTAYFTWLMAGLVTVFILVLPIAMFNRMTRERREATLELLIISKVRAGQVVAGYLWGTMAQMALYLFLCFPFLVFAYLFRGLEMNVVFWAMFFALLAGVAFNASSLMIGSFCRTPRSTMITRVIFYLGIVFVIMPSLYSGVVGYLMFGMASSSGMGLGGPSAMPWEVPTILSVVAVIWVALCLIFARSNLLFEAANRTTLPRVAVTLTFLLMGVILLGFAHFTTGMDEQFVYMFDTLTFLSLALYGFWILNERNEITPRMREGFPRNPLLRALSLVFLPGRGTAFLYVLFNMILLSAISLYAHHVIRHSLSIKDMNWIILKPFSMLAVGLAMLAHHLALRTRARWLPYIAWLAIVVCLMLWAPLLFGVQGWYASRDSFLFPNLLKAGMWWEPNVLIRAVGAPLIGLLAALPAISQNIRNVFRKS